GQYVNLFTEIDGVRTSRPYSISSSPRQRAYYEITVAATKDGFVSDYFLNNVKTGDCFLANGPAGVFRFQPVFHSKKSLFLAGGSGITPFMSMLREIIDAGLDRDVVMLYGCRCEDAALYHDELCAYAAANDNFAYHLVVSDDAEEWKGEKGFINEELIRRLVPDFAERTCYICGPQIMNDFCKNELENMGMPIKRIRREMFGSRRDIQNEPGWPKELSGSEVFNIKVGERVIDAKSGESVLCALERAGIRVNVCCRSGECSLCRVKLVSGKVFLSKGIMLRMADEKFGYIHSCKAYPIGDIEISI
ncbi:MAG: iron-sulfur cluster-binding domain-containing protein, partial [Oscillospiraceae bacterium]